MIHVVKENQSGVDVSVMTYGRADQYFKLLKENGKRNIPPILEIGESITYTDDTIDKEVVGILNKEKLEVATKVDFIEDENPVNGAFSNGFNNQAFL